jgi:hypothetical protein
MVINKDEVGILTENITANISVLQNLKFCGSLCSFGWKNGSIIVKHQVTFMVIKYLRVSMKSKLSVSLIQNKNKPCKNYVQRWGGE